MSDDSENRAIVVIEEQADKTYAALSSMVCGILA